MIPLSLSNSSPLNLTIPAATGSLDFIPENIEMDDSPWTWLSLIYILIIDTIKLKYFLIAWIRNDLIIYIYSIAKSTEVLISGITDLRGALPFPMLKWKLFVALNRKQHIDSETILLIFQSINYPLWTASTDISRDPLL